MNNIYQIPLTIPLKESIKWTMVTCRTRSASRIITHSTRCSRALEGSYPRGQGGVCTSTGNWDMGRS